MAVRFIKQPRLEELSFKAQHHEEAVSQRPSSFSLACAVHKQDEAYDAVRMGVEITNKEKDVLLEGCVQYSFTLEDGVNVDRKDVIDEFWPVIRRLMLTAFAGFEIQPPTLPWENPFANTHKPESR